MQITLSRFSASSSALTPRMVKWTNSFPVLARFCWCARWPVKPYGCLRSRQGLGLPPCQFARLHVPHGGEKIAKSYEPWPIFDK